MAAHLENSDIAAALGSEDIRGRIRRGMFDGHTSGLAAGKLQCNLAILPEAYALDFLRFCQRNPKPCPLVGVGDTGDPALPTLGEDIDIRTDVPRYRIFHDGELTGEVSDIRDLWRDDFVTVALGCSFTFENALIQTGIPLRHVNLGQNVSMFRTNIDLRSAGPFSGKMVVTMRPIPFDRVEQAREISARFPHAHGTPIAIGDVSALGIRDLSTPDYGDPVEIKRDEVPVFWACGVTPQNVLRAANLPLCITHAPGHMLITDVAEDAETTIYQTKPNKETKE
ncbi:MAG: putative hydro-lyase [Pseudomonadota bacterium]